MTVPRASWRATAAIRWSRCSSTWRAAAPRMPPRHCRYRRRASLPRRCHERARPASRHLAQPNRCDDPALLVLVAVVLAAASGTDVLAAAAGHHLGLPANLYRAKCQLLPARRRYADRRGDPVGHPVPRPARLFHLLPGGDVGAQPRQPDDESAQADRVSACADGDERDPARDRADTDDAARARSVSLQFLQPRAAADRLLLQSDLHELGGRNLRVRT